MPYICLSKKKKIIVNSIAGVVFCLLFSFSLFLGLQVNLTYGNIGLVGVGLLLIEYIFMYRNPTKALYTIITRFIAMVWLVNGLFCKVLNFVPRHEQIVARILGESHSSVLIILIGISEIVMAIWVLSKFKPKFNAVTQILIIGIMNVLEFFSCS